LGLVRLLALRLVNLAEPDMMLVKQLPWIQELQLVKIEFVVPMLAGDIAKMGSRLQLLRSLKIAQKHSELAL
jgi:hypothetical protein